MSLAKAAIRMELTRIDGIKVNLNQAVDSLSAFVETKDLDFGDSRTAKSIDVVLLRILNGSGLSVNGRLIIKYRENPDGPLLVGATIALSDVSAPLDVRMPDAPFIRFRIEDTTVSTIWQLAGMEVWGSAEGERF